MIRPNTRRAAVALALLGCTALAAPAFALQVPEPDSAGEKRVRHTPYAPNEVIRLLAPAEGATQFVMSPDETKFDVSVVSKLWRHDASGNTVVFAPQPGAPTTVAHVVSSLPDGGSRRYTLELTAAADGVKPTVVPGAGEARVASNDPAAGSSGASGASPDDAPYLVVRVTYAKEDAARRVAQAQAQRAARVAVWRAKRAEAAAPRSDVQARAVLAQDTSALRRECTRETGRRDFMWRGDAALLPAAACNTGAATTFLWPGQAPAAALFIVGDDGSEQSVTQSASPDRPGYVVVPATSRFWRIRRGKAVADLYDAAWDAMGLDTGTDTLSPRVRTRLRAEVPEAASRSLPPGYGPLP